MITAEQIEAVWPDCVVAARSAAARVGQSHLSDECVGAAGVRVCEEAARYDPAGGASWKTWATKAAFHAAQDLLRRYLPRGHAKAIRSGLDVPTVFSLGHPAAAWHAGQLEGRCSDPAEIVASADAAEWLLRQAGRDRWAVEAFVVRGVQQIDIAASEGCHQSWVWQCVRRGLDSIATEVHRVDSQA